MYWILFIGIALMSYLVQLNLKSKFEKYGKVNLASGLTGAEVAEKMLRDNGIYNVTVEAQEGFLTDHYDPTAHTIRLSRDVYYGRSVAAAAVAAHETGHAVQHATLYAPLQMRSALVPVVNFASHTVQWVLLAGIIFVQSFPQLLLAGIVLFALTTLFSFITLPVEINASVRAVQWLNRAGITSPAEHPMACSALRSAAYTYVVAALASLGTLCYYILIFVSSRD